MIWFLGDLGLQVIKNKKTIPVMAATPPASGHNGGIPRNQQHDPSSGGRPAKQDCSSPFKEAANLTCVGWFPGFTGRDVCWLIARDVWEEVTFLIEFSTRKIYPQMSWVKNS